MIVRPSPLLCLFSLCCAAAVAAQTSPPPLSADLGRVLTFETEHAGGAPRGWVLLPAGSIAADGQVVHSGRWAARLERGADSPDANTVMLLTVPADLAGRAVELRGFLRTERVVGSAMLWMRQDGAGGVLAFGNMAGREIKGTTEWARCSITLPLHPEARTIVVGAMLAGTGKVWVDDLEVLVDGTPVWEVPRVERPKTALDLDRQFDGGSGVALAALTPLQVQNLVTLGKVWGFLKYHHPLVTDGKRHWDYDLLRVLPSVLAASNREAAHAVIARWVADVGDVAPCPPCAALEEKDIHLRPSLGWLADEAGLGADLSARLRTIYRNRPTNGRQFYVSLAPNVGNPSFDHELAYQSLKWPDAGFQILAVFRFWNIIEYWFPYRDVVAGDWDRVLATSLPRVALAKTSEDYQLEMMAVIAAAGDTHANLWSSLKVRPPVGECRIPVLVRFVGEEAVVAGYADAATGPGSGLERGDVIVEIEGVAIPTLVDRWRPYYAASNEPTRLRDIGRAMTNGPCGPVTLRVRRQNQTVAVSAARLKEQESGAMPPTHDLPGDTFRLLSEKVAYLKLSSVKAAEVVRYVTAAAGTAGLIIDIRNYPSEFMVFRLGSLLVDAATPFARFTRGDLVNPGAFYWTEPLKLSPGAPHYGGRVVILVDEVSQSQAEYTSMAFRAARGAIVVGSTTAGADGNVSPIPVPGGFRTMISGIGVFYPDMRPTQRVGILPDVEVRPTVAGIRAGRDEVLEEALRRILGPGPPSSEIEGIARRAVEAKPPK